ncbi:MAG TPA: CRISPR-associated endonuclease Cas3'' [Firmicutes bacterium]|nr:CRISPR-associated endonuclease Cas3'' [Bacillota bacterium]
MQVASVVPFEQCIARPASSDDRRSNLLSSHLLYVAEAMGDHGGDLESRLMFLAGLCHDAGKATARWQRYISSSSFNGVVASGGNHSPLGSLIFFLCAEDICPARPPENDYLIANLTLDIASHHSTLHDIDPQAIPWEEVFVPFRGTLGFETIDLDGLFGFIRNYYPEVGLSSESFRSRAEAADRRWERVAQRAKRYAARLMERVSNYDFTAAKLILRDRTAALIAGDRFHAAALESVEFTQAEARRAIESLTLECERRLRMATGSATSVAQLRARAQTEALESYRSHPDRTIYSLELATGLGKTFSALRVGLEAIASGRCRRIIYVAPYISILSQSTEVIKQGTGISDVLQHHHLSVLEQGGHVGPAGEADGADEADSEALLADDDALMLDSWQAKIVTTTFNQFFLALFPRRAQHTMRIQALKDAFVIIDEPQVLDHATWGAFLRALEAAATRLNFQAVLCTATLPQASNYLDEAPLCLSKWDVSEPRYVVGVSDEAFYAHDLAYLAIEKVKEHGSVAVILNTVADAANVYVEAKRLINGGISCDDTPNDSMRGMSMGRSTDSMSDIKIFHLSGGMTPIHKTLWIEDIRDALARGSGVRCLVISTQILEAGVDLSFRCIIRSRSVIPSIIQTAGRGNRHGEGNPAEIIVVDFARNDGVDPRRYVYVNPVFREVTDNLLGRYKRFSELESRSIIEDFYQQAFKRNPPTGMMQAIYDAAGGQWSSISRLEPFGGDYPKVDVFVPFVPSRLPSGSTEVDLPKGVCRALRYFGISRISEIYELYLDKGFRRGLSFQDRKRFMAMMGYFCVGMSSKRAASIVSLQRNLGIGRLRDDDHYDAETGIALVEDSAEFRIM